VTAATENEPFAYTLFNWIRTYKKALYASFPHLDGSQARHQSDMDRYRKLKDSLANFESRYRGEKRWRPGAVISAFLSGDARHNYLAVLHHVLDNPTVWQDSPDKAFNTLWQSFFAMAGLDKESFSHLVTGHIAHGRLPVLMVSFPDASADFQFNQRLKLTFKNGEASHTVNLRYMLPCMTNRTLGEQITALKQYWASIRNGALIELKFAKNWPTDGVRNDIEKSRVTELTEKFFRGLTPKSQELVRKHPEAVRVVFNKHL
jgi:hypothetical protein